MANEPTTAPAASQPLQASQVYAMAAICLAVGLGIGYLGRGSLPAASAVQPTANVPRPAAPMGAMGGGAMANLQEMQPMAGKQGQPPATAGAAPAAGGATGGGRAVSLGDLRQMADKQAAPLLEKLKGDPNNGAVLLQLGAIYHTTHQFRQAAGYYGKAVQMDPKNVATRTKFASSLFRDGDSDGAIAQLNQALAYDPKDANALFDLGMIKLQGKQDGKGALAAWQQLLKTNPQLSADRKAAVQKMIADVLTMQGDQHGIEGAASHDGHKSNSN